jgi:hypothetical protein
MLAVLATACSKRPPPAASRSPTAVVERQKFESTKNSAGAPNRSQARPSPTVAADSEPAESTSFGRFRLRLDDELPGDGVLDCIPFIYDLALVGSDEAWVVGGCGLRGRLTQNGFVDLNAPRVKANGMLGGERWDCEASTDYRSVAVRSPTEVYVSGLIGCGLDPNRVVSRPIEVFDGKEFRTLRGTSPFQKSEGRSPDVLVAGNDSLFVLALGNDWPGPPACAVYEFKRERWSRLRACPRPLYHPGPVEQFTSLGQDPQGRLWISGRRFPADASEKDTGSPLLLKQLGKQWHEVPIGDTGELVTASDGTLWLFGDATWRLDEDSWLKVAASHPADASEFAVVGSADHWAISDTRIYHYDGQHWTAVVFERPDDQTSSFSHIRASKTQVWVHSPLHVWALVPLDRPFVPVSHKRWGVAASREQSAAIHPPFDENGR